MNGQESPRDLTSTLKQIKLACLLPNIQMQKAGEEVIYQGDASLPASDLERCARLIERARTRGTFVSYSRLRKPGGMMTDLESTAHHLVARLRYLLSRLEDEFFHVHPDLDSNGSTTSLAFSSILNEALNLHEAAFPDGTSKFWDSIKKWGDSQNWEWNDIVIRFTRWPVLVSLRPFHLDPDGILKIVGRDSNNAVKHKGKLATLSDAVHACAVAWFLVLEKAREAEIFFGTSDIDELMALFDCFELIGFSTNECGNAVARPLVNRVEYPIVRGRSEVPLAKAAYERRYSRWKK